jgi:ribose transport system permease protein
MMPRRNYAGNSSWIWAAIGALALWFIMGVFRGRLNAESLIANAFAASYLAILAFGQMLVVTSGKGAIDLSIPGVLTLMAFVSMKIISGQDANVPLALLVVVLLACVIGFLNSLMVIYLKIPAIIATMAMNYILTTAALLINRNYSVFSIAPVLQAITRRRLFYLPVIIYMVAILSFILWLLLNKTSYGKSLMAIGQNHTAAKLAGVKVVQVEMLTYIFSSVLAAIAGLLIPARVGGALLGMGDMYTMETVASIVVGGTLMSGGRASVPGTLSGCLFLGLVGSAMQIMGLPIGAQNISKGFIILFVLFIGAIRSFPFLFKYPFSELKQGVSK